MGSTLWVHPGSPPRPGSDTGCSRLHLPSSSRLRCGPVVPARLRFGSALVRLGSDTIRLGFGSARLRLSCGSGLAQDPRRCHPKVLIGPPAEEEDRALQLSVSLSTLEKGPADAHPDPPEGPAGRGAREGNAEGDGIAIRL